MTRPQQKEFSRREAQLLGRMCPMTLQRRFQTPIPPGLIRTGQGEANTQLGNTISIIASLIVNPFHSVKKWLVLAAASRREKKQLVTSQRNACCLISACALQASFCEIRGGFWRLWMTNPGCLLEWSHSGASHCTFLPTLSHIARPQGHSKAGTHLGETIGSRSQISEELLLKRRPPRREDALAPFHRASAVAKSRRKAAWKGWMSE